MSGASLVKSVSVPSMINPGFWLPNPAPSLVAAKRKVTLPSKKEFAVSPSSIRELTSNANDLRSVIEISRQIDFSAAFAIRNLIDNILAGKLNGSRVFVSETGDFNRSNSNLKAISVVYRFGTNDEIDNAAIWASDRNSAKDHIQTLATSRRWHSRGVVMVNIRSDFISILQEIFPDPQRSYFTPIPPSRLYVSVPYTREELEEKCFPSFRSLPAQFEFDRLRAEDAEMVAENWDFVRPGKLEYVRWLIEQFAGVCIRDTSNGGRAISWGLINEFGAKGFKFVLPQYRRHGLSVANMYALLLASVDPLFLADGEGRRMEKIDQKSTRVFYALVADENKASIKGNAKARFMPTETRCTRFVYRKRPLIELGNINS